MKYFIRLLAKLGLLKYFNLGTQISINQKKVWIPIVNNLGLKHLEGRDSWLFDLLNYVHKHNSNTTFLDIGVNIGQTLLQVKSIDANWTYLGFEPNPNCQFYVQKLIEANRFQKAKIYPVAASKKLELINLYKNSATDATATIVEDFRPGHYDKELAGISIGINLDAILLHESNIGTEFLVKIDVEGAEYMALEGMSKFLEAFNPFIICEILDSHTKETIPESKRRIDIIQHILKTHDYNIYRILKTANDKKVLSLDPVETIEIRVWAEESLALNDYLFVPLAKETELNNIFTNLVKK